MQIILKNMRLYLSRQNLLRKSDFVALVEDTLLQQTRGVIHMGAHFGQEAPHYAELSLKVIWIEAIPEVFVNLKSHVSKFANQEAILALLGDQDGKEVNFHVSSNNYASSSIFGFGNNFGFKGIKIKSVIPLRMAKLDSVLANYELADYSHWIIDVQGAELLLLEGAHNSLKFCKSLRIEISDREVYEGGARWSEVKDLLISEGFQPLWEPDYRGHEDIIFVRI